MAQANERPIPPRPNMVATDEQIVDAIRVFWENNGYAPTVREVGAAVGIKSPSTIKYRFEQLREKGLVAYNDRIPRTIRVIGR